MIKNILMVYGINQYGVLNIFGEELETEWTNMGLKVHKVYLDGRSQRLQMDEMDLVFSFNGIGIREFVENNILLNENTFVWSFYLDHPMWHHNRLLTRYRNSICSFVDRNHVRYASRFYKESGYPLFVPHGGINKGNRKKWCEKTYEVVFLGTYSPAVESLTILQNYNKSMVELLIGVVEEWCSCYTNTLEEALARRLKDVGIMLSDKEFRETMWQINFLDQYVRNQERFDVIESLISAGIKVHVFGNGWDKFDTQHKDFLMVHENVEHEEALRIMADSKIVLNILPRFADGSHERVFTAMAQGSVCVTDRNIYLEESLEDGKNIIFYSKSEPEELVDKVRRILDGRIDGEKIASNAFEKSNTEHLWRNRAHEILRVANGCVKESTN